MFEFSGRDYARIEYMGPGCPHYYRRPFMLGVRTKNYSVVIEIGLKQEFEEFKFVTCFDLKEDPLELNNLACTYIDKSKITKELEIIRERFEKLKKEINGNGYYKPAKKE